MKDAVSSCREIADRLTSYVDGELPSESRAAVERHLGECPPCRRAAEATAAGRLVLRRCAAALRDEPLPPGLKSRCEALAREHRARTGTWTARLVPALAVAALLLITASTLFALATRRSDVLLTQQLALDHAKCFKLFAEAEARGADPLETEMMLRDKYGWDLHVPPSSAAEGITLIGARRCLYAEGTMPHVMYRMGNADLSLFVLNGVRRPTNDVRTLGHRSHIWSDGGTTYVLVSQQSDVDLDRAVRYVSQRLP
jgi:anti-sigma factor (TIGR02949 family)